MKKKIIIVAIVVAVVFGLLAFYKYMPFYVTIVATGAFVAGALLGVYWYKRKKKGGRK